MTRAPHFLIYLAYLATLGACKVEGGLPGGGDGAMNVGGQCPERFPPASCSAPEGTLHPIDHSELQRLLPGRWLWCGGDMIGGMPLKLGPPDAIGFEFNTNATLWWFLVDDGHGIPAHRTGFESGGTVQFLGNKDPSWLQLNLVKSSNGYFTLLPAITEGPPLRLRLISHGPSAVYVRDESGCGGPVGDAPDFGVSPQQDLWPGGACDPNVVTGASCPPINGVHCSVCQYAAMIWQCVLPCHLAMNDCPAQKKCQRLDDYTLGGDCIGFDGYCW